MLFSSFSFFFMHIYSRLSEKKNKLFKKKHRSSVDSKIAPDIVQIFKMGTQLVIHTVTVLHLFDWVGWSLRKLTLTVVNISFPNRDAKRIRGRGFFGSNLHFPAIALSFLKTHSQTGLGEMAEAITALIGCAFFLPSQGCKNLDEEISTSLSAPVWNPGKRSKLQLVAQIRFSRKIFQ